MGYIFRNFTREDIPQIMDLQFAYQRVYPKAVVIPGEVYISPFLNGGKYMVCAFDDAGQMQGYTGVNIYVSEKPDAPHTLWSIIKVRPALADKEALQETLFQKTLGICRGILVLYPGWPARLQFQHYTGEADIISFLKNKGCVYLESAFHMICDLSGNIPEFLLPRGIDIRYLNTDDIPEQQSYLNAHNGSFPARVYSFKDWEFFLNNQIGKTGRVVISLDSGRVIGGVSVYIDDEFNRRAGMAVGQIEDVFVSESHRHCGIAAYLISFGKKYLKDSGLRYAHLEVRANNSNALKLYKKTGFVATDETQFYTLMLQESK